MKEDPLCFSEYRIATVVMLREHRICLAQLKLRHFASLNDAYLTANSFGNEPNDLLLWDTEVNFIELRKETVTSYTERSSLLSKTAGKSFTRKVFQLLDLK